MAITRYAGDRFYGLDAEKSSLLSKVIDGAIYNASDTLFQYIKINGTWEKEYFPYEDCPR